jgi:hypothetical protein
MANASSLHGLMKFLKREEWREAFAETTHEHFFAACKNAGVDMDRLAGILDHHTAMTLWGCAFEDFLARPLPDGRNMVDDYLRRRGYKESASAKAYMKAIRHSVMSLYEVSDIVPGRSFLARDLIRGGEPVQVTEHSATRQMKPWDRIAARIVTLGGTYQMCGGALVYSLQMSEKLLAELARLEDRLERGTYELVEEIGASLDADRLADIIADGGCLEVAAHLFTHIWLADALDRTLNRRLPKLVNAEGDAIVFCTLTFPLAGAAGAGQICSALDAVDDLRREGDTAFYNWIGVENAPDRSAEGITLNTMHSEGGRVLGGIEVGEGTVVATTNSLQRAERARLKLTQVLGAMVGEPTLSTETPEEAMAKRERTSETDEVAPKLQLPPDEEERLVHSCLDDHYRKTLDQGMPMLDGMTPREAARTAAGRARVATWLKYLENQSRKRRDPGDPLATYDVGWLWTELGVTELRV